MLLAWYVLLEEGMGVDLNRDRELETNTRRHAWEIA